MAYNHPEKHWILPRPVPELIDQKLNRYPKPIRQLLFNRGYEDTLTSQKFLNADYPFEDPNHLMGMDKTVDRIAHAIHFKNPIAVYGDYDADGVTATALLVQVINQLGGLVIPYIPNRFDEGYGINIDALDRLKEVGIDLVISVDCGIRSVIETVHANEIGLTLIISDHHYPKGKLPPAYAVICPKQADDPYLFKELAGVGLAYKIAQALIEKFHDSGLEIENWLDLVALGSVADMVPLIEENRTMVRAGLDYLQKSQRVGIKALAEVSQLNLETLTSSNIGFILGPRLNAAGRVESARTALQLMMVQDSSAAKLLAEDLDRQNRERQQLTQKVQEQAREIVIQSENEILLFAVQEEFNEGIVGLAASKLTEEFYRPAIVGTVRKDGTVHASCRSIKEFHITHALDECADLLINHGGHALAAGFTVSEDHLDELRDRMEKIAIRELREMELIPTLSADTEVTLTELKPLLIPYLNQFEPSGIENPSPSFYSRNVRVSHAKSIGKENVHLKMTLNDGLFSFDAIAFRFGDLADKLQDATIDILFAFEMNHFRDEDRLQLRIVDLKPSKGKSVDESHRSNNHRIS